MVTGSTGIKGCADTILLLERKRHEVVANLHVMGRDVEERKLAIQFDKQSCRWELLGEAGAYKQSTERDELLEALAERPMKPNELAKSLGKDGNNIRQLLLKMKNCGDVTHNKDGTYTPSNTDNGSNGAWTI